tara:strand:- start:1028 stop:1225 length:198 start_codon:yes stop_codon:yes gene_type:complete
MNTSKQQLYFYDKAVKVIDSCEKMVHFDGAMRYVDNFRKFGTKTQYEHLLNYLHKKLNSHGNQEE